jgi:hypothetical protein
VSRDTRTSNCHVRAAFGGGAPFHGFERELVSHEPITAHSSPATDADQAKRELVVDLLKNQGKSFAEYGKHIATLSFAGIGAVLTLNKEWLGESATGSQKAALASAIVLFLLAAVMGTIGAGLYEHRVSLDDYLDVEAELARVAQRRFWIITLAVALASVATAIIGATVLF